MNEPINREQAIKDLNQSGTALLNVIQTIPDSEFNRKPTETSWSVAQILEHLIKTESQCLKIIKGNTQKASRHPDLNIPKLNAVLLNFQIKRDARAEIQPGVCQNTKAELICNFSDIRKQLSECLSQSDLSLSCSDFQHSAFGYLTRLEWLHLIIYHSKRHLHQIENIIKSHP